MVVKRFIISISVLFFYALLLQAKNEVIDHGHFLCSYYYSAEEIFFFSTFLRNR